MTSLRALRSWLYFWPGSWAMSRRSPGTIGKRLAHRAAGRIPGKGLGRGFRNVLLATHLTSPVLAKEGVDFFDVQARLIGRAVVAGKRWHVDFFDAKSRRGGDGSSGRGGVGADVTELRRGVADRMLVH